MSELSIKKCSICQNEFAYSEQYQICPYCVESGANEGSIENIAIEGLLKISRGYLDLSGNPSGKLFSSEDCKSIADKYLAALRRD